MTAGTIQLEGETVDISMNGMMVKAAQCIPAGSAVGVRLDLVPGAKPFMASGSVRRIVGGNQMGIEFNLTSHVENGRLQELLLPLIIRQ